MGLVEGARTSRNGPVFWDGTFPYPYIAEHMFRERLLSELWLLLTSDWFHVDIFPYALICGIRCGLLAYRTNAICVGIFFVPMVKHMLGCGVLRRVKNWSNLFLPCFQTKKVSSTYRYHMDGLDWVSWSLPWITEWLCHELVHKSSHSIKNSFMLSNHKV